MRTWILCADNLCAKIFVKRTDEDRARLYYTIPGPRRNSRSRQNTKEFIRYVADEIELACGAGTDSQLILCAEKEMLSHFCKRFSGQVKGVLVGTVEQDLCNASQEYISTCSERILGVTAQTSQRAA